MQAPIFHVNGDDPEACVRVARLAFKYRQQFHKDVVIDMVCYRRHGHNEGDDPSYTQPLMYKAIAERRSVRKIYVETLVKRGDITRRRGRGRARRLPVEAAGRARRRRGPTHPRPTKAAKPPQAARVCCRTSTTGVDRATLDAIFAQLTNYPADFTLHPKLGRQFETRAKTVRRDGDGRLGDGRGARARLAAARGDAGPARRRGHAAAARSASATRRSIDYENGEGVHPARRVARAKAPFWVYDSLLSEYAALGYE